MCEFLEWVEFRVADFIKHWIWPAYHLKNLLFNRFDLVRLPGIKKYEYSDTVERLFLANMELVKNFIEKEHPEKHVCWYGEDDISGPRWYAGEHSMFAQAAVYEGKFIMDIIKEVYNWYTVEYPTITDFSRYLLDQWSEQREGFPNVAETYMEEHNKLEKRIFEEKQKYLHLCVELRPYLWT